MNEATITQLKIIVERAVRPVHASISQKRKMREELLAHVIGAFEEETPRSDETTALVRTRERFGAPEELTAQLQGSVPRSDRLLRFIENLLDHRPDESPVRRAMRFGLMLSAVFGILILPPFIIQNRFSEWSVIPAAGVLMFAFTMMTHWMREALHGLEGRSWLRAGLVAIGAGFLIAGVTFGICLIYTGDAWSSMMTVLPMLPFGLILAWIPVALVAHLSALERRARREWESLEIG
jgi:hypothetical protein